MQKLISELRKFNEERDWDQFHTEENLAKSICIEAGELLECFQWNHDYELDEVSEELADVFSYCIMLADKLNLNIEDNLRSVLSALKSFLKKERIYVTINDKKYPVEKAKGTSTKYTKL